MQHVDASFTQEQLLARIELCHSMRPTHAHALRVILICCMHKHSLSDYFKCMEEMIYGPIVPD